MSQPLVSIGVPTFNRPASLRRVLGELAAQDYDNMEVLVSDNGSDGNETRDVAMEFVERDKRFRYFRQPENRGSTANFQYLVENTSGEFFAWAADDDSREPAFVSALAARLIENPGAVIAFCDFTFCRPDMTQHLTSARSHLRFLDELSVENPMLRMWNFTLQAEKHGKVMAFYGLIRRRFLEEIHLVDFVNRHGPDGADGRILSVLLQQGHVALDDRLLFRACVGNPKQHGVGGPKRRKLARSFYKRAIWLKSIWKCPALVKDWKVLAAVLAASVVRLLFPRSGNWHSLRRGSAQHEKMAAISRTRLAE